MKKVYPVISNKKSDLQTKKTGNYEHAKCKLSEISGSGVDHRQTDGVLQNDENRAARSFTDPDHYCYFLGVCRLQDGFNRKYCLTCSTRGPVNHHTGNF